MREHNGKTYLENAPHDMQELLEIVAILHGPEGCPWDKSQTHESLKKCLTDEAEEVLLAIDNKDDVNLCEELGDVLLQVLAHCELARMRGAFDFSDVVQMLSEKLIRRHPHVFGDARMPETDEEALELWRAVKQEEKRRQGEETV
ncbi:MAG: MazG nucleotide pyrophosphohydrolase domain-containing protein [Acetatifactor sp.]